MKTLIIIARDSMLKELEELLRNNGVMAYTTLSNVSGQGVTGKVYGTFLNPAINAVICAVLTTDEADKAIIALKTFHTRRKETAPRDQPIPLKVFSWFCDEHV